MKMDNILIKEWLKILTQILLTWMGNIAKSAPTHCLKHWRWKFYNINLQNRLAFFHINSFSA